MTTRNNRKLSAKEEKDLVKLLKKVRLPAPLPVFRALCQSVPMVAIDLAVMPDDQRLLLTYRKDEFYDAWHIPGSILCSGESPADALKRISRQELKLKITSPRFVNYFSINGSRGQEIILLFVARPIEKPRIGDYFKFSRLPKRFLKEQSPETNFLKKLSAGHCLF